MIDIYDPSIPSSLRTYLGARLDINQLGSRSLWSLRYVLAAPAPYVIAENAEHALSALERVEFRIYCACLRPHALRTAVIPFTAQ